jgi:hypothetical protein
MIAFECLSLHCCQVTGTEDGDVVQHAILVLSRGNCSVRGYSSIPEAEQETIQGINKNENKTMTDGCYHENKTTISRQLPVDSNSNHFKFDQWQLNAKVMGSTINSAKFYINLSIV